MKTKLAFGAGRAEITTDVDATWRVTYGLTLQPDGRPVLHDLRVELRESAALPPNGLTGEVVQQIRVGDYAYKLEAHLAAGRRPPKDPAQHARHREELAFREAFYRKARLDPNFSVPRRRPRPRRPRLSDLELARAAQTYIRTIEARSPRPVVEAATQLKDTAQHLRDVLHRARHRRLLVGGGAGVAVGVLT